MINLTTIRRHNIDDNLMNRQLRTLYNDMFPSLSGIISQYNRANESRISNPYLLSASKEYYVAERRVMIFGQETYTWGGEFGNEGVFNPDASVTELMNLYDLFAYTASDTYNSPFWNYCKSLKSAADGRRIAFIYNNLMKLGLVGQAGYNPDISPKFNPLLAEIEILKPDILIFLSGPKYDFRIRTQLDNFLEEQVLPQYKTQEFAKLRFSDTIFPDAYRTYHPGYLCRWPDYYAAVHNAIIHYINL